jgi:hypothetical protein
VAYGRRLGAETLIVVLNSGRQPATVDLPVAGYLGEGALLHDVWDHTEGKVSHGKIPGVVVPARTGVVLATRDQG